MMHYAVNDKTLIPNHREYSKLKEKLNELYHDSELVLKEIPDLTHEEKTRLQRDKRLAKDAMLLYFSENIDKEASNDE
jgi:hypothetical protein